MYTLYFTGHRSLQNKNNIRRQISESLDYFISRHGKIQCKSSLASGADTLFVQEVLKKNIPLEIVLPFEIEEFKKDFSPADLAVFNRLIEKLEYRIHTKLNSHSPDKKNQAYFDTGKEMIHQSDAILAVWDGEAREGLGGTKDNIDYALKLEKEFHLIKAFKINKAYTDNRESMELLTKFNEQDRRATRLKKLYEKTWSLGLVLGILAVICFGVNFNFITAHYPGLKFTLSLFELFFLLASFYLLSQIANTFKNRFALSRGDAENLRATIWLQETESIKKWVSIYEEEAKSNRLMFYNLHRILWMHARSQINYQQKNRVDRFSYHLKFSNRVLEVIKYFFFITVTALAVVEGTHFLNIHFLFDRDECVKWLCFFWILTPPVYASTEGVIYFNEWKKKISDSLQLIKEFTEVSNAIFQCQNLEGLTLIENDLHQKFSSEHENWVKAQMGKKIHGKI